MWLETPKPVSLGLIPMTVFFHFFGCMEAGGDDSNNPPDPAAQKTTVRLEADPNGDLELCPQDADTCRFFSNPDSCAVIVVIIENDTGKACETCEDGDGNVLYHRCEQTRVACEIVRAPEPDCIVCAYVGGHVIHTTCVVGQDNGGGGTGGSGSEPRCEAVTMASYPPVECKVCYDDAGSVVSRDCESRCDLVDCEPLTCPDDARQWTAEGACCPVCEPSRDCALVDCVPNGPTCVPGTEPVLLPDDCCNYTCEPLQRTRCSSSTDCGESQICSTEEGDCDPSPACANDPDVDCDAVCYGVCVEICDEIECGPAPGMPNYYCPDGTVAGPGPCERNANGVCGWTIISCPDPVTQLEELLTETAQCGFVEVWALDSTDSAWLRLRFGGADQQELGVWSSYDLDLPSEQLDVRLQMGTDLTINACTDALSIPGPMVDAEYRPVSGRASLRVIRDSSTAAWEGSDIYLDQGRVQIVLEQVVFSNGAQTLELGSLVIDELTVYDIIHG